MSTAIHLHLLWAFVAFLGWNLPPIYAYFFQVTCVSCNDSFIHNWNPKGQGKILSCTHVAKFLRTHSAYCRTLQRTLCLKQDSTTPLVGPTDVSIWKLQPEVRKYSHLSCLSIRFSNQWLRVITFLAAWFPHFNHFKEEKLTEVHVTMIWKSHFFSVWNMLVNKTTWGDPHRH